MWIKPNSYISYSYLLENYHLLKEDMTQWLLTHTPERDSVAVYNDEFQVNPFMSTTTNFVETWTTQEEYEHRHDWKSIPVFFEKKWYKETFPRFWEAGSKLPGLRQCMINFISPRGKITLHTDVDNWAKMSEDWGFKCEGYSLIATVQSGMTNRKDKTVGTSLKDVEEGIDVWKFPLVDEFVCFDGLNVNHSIINNTDIWRISAVFDIDKTSFRDEYIKTEAQVCG